MEKIVEEINRFNNKYLGQEIWNCPYLGTWINFDYEYVTFCCSRTNYHIMDNPPICSTKEVNENKFNRELFYTRLLETYKMNQKEKGPCNGCKHLKKYTFKGINLNGSIEHLSYNNYRGCNSRCIYCFQQKNKLIESYKAYELIEKLNDEKMVSNNAVIDFGGVNLLFYRTFQSILKSQIKIIGVCQ